jgi:hypothetical protein
MFRPIFFAAIISLSLIGCDKKEAINAPSTDEERIRGTWLVQGNTIPSLPADTLYFTNQNGTYTLSFDCSGSPGPNWPKRANTEYKFENGKLAYKVYYDNSGSFYTANSFKWIVPGEEFEINRNQLLLYMSSVYAVRYKKIN